jgi:hypothetical protein
MPLSIFPSASFFINFPDISKTLMEMFSDSGSENEMTVEEETGLGATDND